jgi:hypothetical protein
VINSSDVPPTAVTAHVTDLVTVKSATYAAGTLTVIATSSDKGDPATLIPPPTLVLDGIPGAVSLPSGGAADPAERTFTVALPVPAVPPPTVRVSSSVGGQGQSDVLMGAAAAFPAGVPLAVDDNAVATAGGGLIIIPVLFNDVTNSAALTASPVAIVTTPNIGTATANASGTVNYTPSALSGTATFTYTVSNSVGKSNVATVTVVVGPSLNPVPVAVNDPSAGTLSVTANTSLVINVLANDSGLGDRWNRRAERHRHGDLHGRGDRRQLQLHLHRGQPQWPTFERGHRRGDRHEPRDHHREGSPVPEPGDPVAGGWLHHRPDRQHDHLHRESRARGADARAGPRHGADLGREVAVQGLQRADLRHPHQPEVDWRRNAERGGGDHPVAS